MTTIAAGLAPLPQTDPEKMDLVTRVMAPTPKFFRKLRQAGLILAAIGGSILASPVAVPVILSQAAGYIALAGAVITSISQTSVVGDQ